MRIGKGDPQGGWTKGHCICVTRKMTVDWRSVTLEGEPSARKQQKSLGKTPETQIRQRGDT